jgi:phosphopantothenoylcysteine decarboxylase/phosphopantothenate--cysteine ligase
MLLHAAGATLPQSKVPQKSFETAADLEQLLKQELGTSPYDAVIHLAAVSDYRVDKILLDGQSAPSSGKLGTHDSLQLILRPQAKLVDSLRAWSCSPKTRIVAFKLTHSHAEQERQAAVQRIIQRAQPDLVVHNEQSERSADSHPFRLYGPQGPLSECNGAVELAQALEAYLREEV